jgi:hypothetical protein
MGYELSLGNHIRDLLLSRAYIGTELDYKIFPSLSNTHPMSEASFKSLLYRFAWPSRQEHFNALEIAINRIQKPISHRKILDWVLQVKKLDFNYPLENRVVVEYYEQLMRLKLEKSGDTSLPSSLLEDKDYLPLYAQAMSIFLKRKPKQEIIRLIKLHKYPITLTIDQFITILDMYSHDVNVLNGLIEAVPGHHLALDVLESIIQVDKSKGNGISPYHKRLWEDALLRIPEPGRLPEVAYPEVRELQKERILLRRQARNLPTPFGTEEHFPLNGDSIKLFLKRNQKTNRFIAFLDSTHKDLSLDQLYHIVSYFKNNDRVLEHLKKFVPPQSREIMDMLDALESTTIKELPAPHRDLVRAAMMKEGRFTNNQFGEQADLNVPDDLYDVNLL